MGTVCLSVAPILRCQSLTRLESGILLLPTGLELIFSVCLIFGKKGKGKAHLLLAAEGIIYFLLALTDLLSHLVTSPRTSLEVFKGLDIFLGAASFVPLLLFTSYLYILTTKELLPSVPRRVQGVARYTLVIFIPLIVIINELSSFVDLTYRVFDPNSRNPTIAVKFSKDNIQTFLNSLVLVFLTVYQALIFSTAFLRLIRAFLNQRRIETSPTGTENEVHLFNGLAWITIGVKLGMIESIIGFTHGGFGEAMVRRLLKMLGRACLVIGVVKGVDTVEDFQIFESRIHQQPQRRSMLRALISNPRNSTFQQLAGYEIESGRTVLPQTTNTRSAGPVSQPLFQPPSPPRIQPFPPPPSQLQARPRSQSQPNPLPLRSLYNPNPTPPHMSAENHRPRSGLVLFPSERRVVARQGRNRAPTLHMRRISDIDVLSTLTTAGTTFDASPTMTTTTGVSPPTAISRPFSTSYTLTSPLSPTLTNVSNLPEQVAVPPQAAVTDRHPSRYTFGEGQRDTVEYMPRSHVRVSSAVLPRQSLYIRQSQGQPSQFESRRNTRQSTASAYSTTSDSLEVVRALTMQFPGLPPRVTPKTRQRDLQSPTEHEEEDPFPVVGISRTSSERTLGGDSLVRRSSSVKRKPVPKVERPISEVDTVEEEKSQLQQSYTDSIKTAATEEGGVMANIPPLPSILSTPNSRLSFASLPQAPPPGARRHTSPNNAAGGGLLSADAGARSNRTSGNTLEFPWVGHDTTNIGAEGEAELEKARKQSGISGPLRIKSVGSAPRRRTPNPTTTTFSRESIVAEWHDMPKDRRVSSKLRKKRGFDGVSEDSKSLRISVVTADTVTSSGITEKSVAAGPGESFLDYR